jgi:hypothetical protein
MKTVNVAAAASLAVVLSMFVSVGAKAQVFDRGQARNAPAETAQEAAPRRAPIRPERADISVRTPRFMVQMHRFEVIDETGSTDIGSDEVLVKYETPGYWMTTSEFGDVDTGETRHIEPWQRCIYPARDPDDLSNRFWECNRQGAPGPVRFAIMLREQDSYLANIHVCDDVHRHRNDLIAPNDCTLSNIDAELIGYVTHDFTVEQLVNALPNEWSTRDFSMDLGSFNSRYRIFYSITRTSDLVGGPVATQ